MDVSPFLFFNKLNHLPVQMPPEGTGAVFAERVRLKAQACCRHRQASRLGEQYAFRNMAVSHQYQPTESDLATWFSSTAALDLAFAVVMASMLTFSVECPDTQPGQAVYIVGSVAELGQWQIWQGASLSSFQSLKHFRTRNYELDGNALLCAVCTHTQIVMDGTFGSVC